VVSLLFAALEKQVVTDGSWISSCSIAEKSPAVLFPFFNCSSNIPMVADFHTFPFSHMSTSFIIIVSIACSVFLIFDFFCIVDKMVVPILGYVSEEDLGKGEDINYGM